MASYALNVLSRGNGKVAPISLFRQACLGLDKVESSRGAGMVVAFGTRLTAAVYNLPRVASIPAALVMMPSLRLTKRNAGWLELRPADTAGTVAIGVTAPGLLVFVLPEIGKIVGLLISAQIG